MTVTVLCKGADMTMMQSGLSVFLGLALLPVAVAVFTAMALREQFPVRQK